MYGLRSDYPDNSTNPSYPRSSHRFTKKQSLPLSILGSQCFLGRFTLEKNIS